MHHVILDGVLDYTEDSKGTMRKFLNKVYSINNNTVSVLMT